MRRLALAGAVASIAVACGDNGTGPAAPGVVGTWHATTVEFVSVADSTRTTELVSQGLTFSLVFLANLTFQNTTTNPGQSPVASSGTYSETATTLSLTQITPPPIVTVTFVRTLSGNALTLARGQVPYQFGSGAVEPAYVTFQLVRP